MHDIGDHWAKKPPQQLFEVTRGCSVLPSAEGFLLGSGTKSMRTAKPQLKADLPQTREGKITSVSEIKVNLTHLTGPERYLDDIVSGQKGIP